MIGKLFARPLWRGSLHWNWGTTSDDATNIEIHWWTWFLSSPLLLDDDACPRIKVCEPGKSLSEKNEEGDERGRQTGALFNLSNCKLVKWGTLAHNGFVTFYYLSGPCPRNWTVNSSSSSILSNYIRPSSSNSELDFYYYTGTGRECPSADRVNYVAEIKIERIVRATKLDCIMVLCRQAGTLPGLNRVLQLQYRGMWDTKDHFPCAGFACARVSQEASSFRGSRCLQLVWFATNDIALSGCRQFQEEDDDDDNKRREYRKVRWGQEIGARR